LCAKQRQLGQTKNTEPKTGDRRFRRPSLNFAFPLARAQSFFTRQQRSGRFTAVLPDFLSRTFNRQTPLLLSSISISKRWHSSAMAAGNSFAGIGRFPPRLAMAALLGLIGWGVYELLLR
jgi:hypothetical protein